RFLTWVRSNPRGSLSHSQGFGRGQDTHSIARFTLAMSGRFCRPSKNWLPTIWQHTIFKIYTYVLKKSYFIFPITKGSVNALMKLAGFSISNKVKNHCTRDCGQFHPQTSWTVVCEGSGQQSLVQWFLTLLEIHAGVVKRYERSWKRVYTA